MAKNIFPFLIKTLLFSALLFLSYYLFFLKPQIKIKNEILYAKKILSLHKNTLAQNRLSYIALTRLDPKDPNFENQKSKVVETLRKTNQEGIKVVENPDQPPNPKIIPPQDFSSLLSETKRIYEDQNKLLEKVFATKSYEEGVAIIKSPEGIEILTRQTNLILKYEFYLRRISSNF